MSFRIYSIMAFAVSLSPCVPQNSIIVKLHPMQPSLKCRSTSHEQFWTTCITTTPKPALQARRRRTLGVGQIFCNARLELEPIDANSSSKSIFCGGDASLSASEAAAGGACKQQLRSTTREKPRVIVIAGPTSVGKTQLSIELAKELNGEVINADSVQVYCGLDIGAAKATMEERQGIPHHLLDMVPASVEYTYEEFMRDSRAATEQILARGRVPIVVGGTGMYMRYYMHAKPGITHKPFEDEAKIIVALAGAGSIRVPDYWDYDFQCYFLHKNRAELFRRLDLRCEQQIMTLLEETSRLLDAGLVADSNSAARATGYEEAIPFLMQARAARGFVTEERLLSMLSLFQHNCRNIARQQIKWYRSKDRSEVQLFHWLDASQPIEKTIADIRNEYLRPTTKPSELSKENSDALKNSSYKEQKQMRNYEPTQHIYSCPEARAQVLNWLMQTQGGGLVLNAPSMY